MVKNFKETAFNYIVGDKTGTFYTAEQKWIRKVRRWLEEYPDDVKIAHENYDDDKLDSIVVELPVKWLKVSPPVKRNLTEEQRQQLRDRLQNARSLKT